MPSLTHTDDYWRTLAQASATDSERDDLGDDEASLSRRSFVQLMGASLAFAGLTGAGCRRWEEEAIVPLGARPDGYIPGVAEHYATAFELAGWANPLLVTSIDGRPLKIEGNPDHPAARGATTTFAQASVLELYDPDRSRRPMWQRDGRRSPATWDDFATFLDELALTARVSILSEASSSPTLAKLISKRSIAGSGFPTLAWHEYEPLSRDNQRAGLELAFARPLRPRLDLAAARTIVALDADLFADHPDALANARGFAASRHPEDAVGASSRLYSIESSFTSTGAMADHRLPLRSELILPFLMALRSVVEGTPAPAADFLADASVARFRDAAAVDLLARSGGEALVVAGHRQPAVVHAQVAALNHYLRAHRRALSYVAAPARTSHVDALADLSKAMHAGEVDVLVMLGGNPLYDAPADLDFAAALARVPASIHLSLYDNETSAQSTWHLPRAHYLESWGDSLAPDGTLTLTQPLIAPLHGGRSPIEIINLMISGKDESARVPIEKHHRLGPERWQRAVHDGLIAAAPAPALAVDEGPVTPPSSPAPGKPSAQGGAARLKLAELAAPALDDRQRAGLTLANGELEIVFTPSAHTYDGRFANSGWLQETPDFMTGVTWENAALISPRTAAELGIANNDLVAISRDGRTVELPAYVMPGQAPYSIALALGHGRRRAGSVGGNVDEGVDPAGFDTYPLRTRDAFYIGAGATVRATGKRHVLATVSDHWQIDRRGRDAVQQRIDVLVRSASHRDYQAHLARYANYAPGYRPELGSKGHTPLLRSLWAPPHQYAGHKWGMAIDLDKCIGCNACMVACQAENNIPIVGRVGVRKSREMHWLRIDRYFKGDPDDPTVAHQPVTCQHCDNAPCEQVCPVGATIHSDEGLNDMAYNRCVGTRYCMNNCPYRVRRFNYYDYHRKLYPTANAVARLAINPDVSVRSRGVMEKCSFCVQRIERGKIAAKNVGRVLADGEVVTACQQVCPTGAIVFGDLNDAASQVSKLHASARAYAMLGEFNNHPATAYLARIRNPSPRLDKP